MFASLDEEIKDFRAQRIEVNSKPGPVQVCLKTEDEVAKILRKKQSLRELDDYKKVFVNPSLTKRERKMDYNLRQIAKVMPKVRFAGGRIHVKTQ